MNIFQRVVCVDDAFDAGAYPHLFFRLPIEGEIYTVTAIQRHGDIDFLELQELQDGVLFDAEGFAPLEETTREREREMAI